jgi:hypothetical protein
MDGWTLLSWSWLCENVHVIRLYYSIVFFFWLPLLLIYESIDRMGVERKLWLAISWRCVGVTGFGYTRLVRFVH